MTDILSDIPSTISRPAGPLLARGSSLAVAVALGAGAATGAIASLPGLRFAYRAPALDVAVETAAAVVALLAAYLVLGRYRRSGLLSDLVLAVALTLMASSTFLFAALPGAVASGGASFVSTWTATVASTGAAAVFAVAAYAPGRAIRNVARGEHRAVLAILLGFGVVALIAALFRNVLPPVLESQLPPETSGRPEIVGNPVFVGLHLAGFAFFSAAAVGFTRRAAASGEELLRWLGIASVLGAASRLNYILYPSLYSQWVYSGDVFRFLLYLVILLAVVQEIRSYWESTAQAAVLEERRRIARDLHDGLAQELAYVLRNVRRLDSGGAVVGRIAGGVDRALNESRRAIAALTEPLDEPLDVALARTAHETGRRVDAHVRVEITPGIEVSREEREALVRIAAEAIANAARHGGSPLITLSCTNGDRIRLAVTDSGRGFDTAAVSGRGENGFGLISMRERASTIGAEFGIVSAPGEGTRVEVTL